MPVTMRSVGAVAALVAGMTATICAHVPEVVTPQTFWRSWSFEPSVVTVLLLTSWLYARGIRRLWAHAGWGRGVSVWRVVLFAAGETTIAVALISPLDALGGTLLSAHMAQHGLLAAVAPPLLLLGRPRIPFAWAFTDRSARAVPRLWRVVSAIELPRSSLLFAAALYGVAIWVWHAPLLFDAAVHDDWVHVAQHLSFFIPAMWFWNALLEATSARRAAMAAAAVFATFMHTGLLGALLTMAAEPLYVAYIGRPQEWGLSALADQQLAGVLMWVPLGLPYVAAGLWLGWRVLGRHSYCTPTAASSNAPVRPVLTEGAP
jgi:putative membrane protein